MDDLGPNGAARDSVEELQQLKDLLNKIRRAVKYQAKDETLWNPMTVGEDYILQSLRWLHLIIEEDLYNYSAFHKIMDQSNGDI